MGDPASKNKVGSSPKEHPKLTSGLHIACAHTHARKHIHTDKLINQHVSIHGGNNLCFNQSKLILCHPERGASPPRSALAMVFFQSPRCQNWEGGIGGVPGMEAHGGYTFCGLAALVILKKERSLNLKSLLVSSCCAIPSLSC